MRRRPCFGLAALVALFGACQSFPDPPVSFVEGLRVLGIKAEPPEVPAGADSALTMLAVDTAGNAIAVDWTECFMPPLPGQTINPDCIGAASAGTLPPAGSGLDVTVTMPHPERVFRSAQNSWHPCGAGEDSGWMRLFRNARVWVG